MERGFGRAPHLCESRGRNRPLIPRTDNLQAALFSAIVTAFLITALDDLGPDYQQQTALLLHQLLNGRDPKLANISDPTIPYKPTDFAIAVNSLWFASLSTSLGAAFGAMICKEWLAEYNSGANPVGFLRACQRQIRFMAFQRWDFDALVALLPPLFHSSIMLFFAGATVYLWEIDEIAGIVYQVIGGIFVIAYLLSTFLPLMVNAPFRPYSMLHFHRLFVAMKNNNISIANVFVHPCYLALRYVTGEILFPFVQATFNDKTFHRWYMYAAGMFPGEYKHMRAWRAKPSDDSMDEIDTSQRVQDEAILWLSQMPLDHSESKDVVSSLALISSRPHKFPSQAIMLFNLALESSLREGTGREQIDVATNYILVLGHIKFQSAVDRNSDRDHNVGGIPITASVAWAAQQFTVSAFRDKFDALRIEGTRVRLLTAAAWLSPVEPTSEDPHWGGGEKLKIQDRHQFIEEIRATLMRHVHGEEVLDNKVLINLIHGMHACIPRGNYGYASSIVSFLPLLCEDYDSPWSKDESVLRALITYALDLLSPPGRGWPLVKREIKFEDLASELVDTLIVNTTSTDVVVFGFWLVYRVPYAFKSRKTMLADIAHIWASAIEPIQYDMPRQRLNFHAVDAFVAIAQCHVSISGALPKFTFHTALKLLNAALEPDYTRPMATYAIAMILNLSKSTQVATVTNEIQEEPFVETLSSTSDDLEKGTVEEDTVDLYIYSTLVLLKCQPTIGLEVGKAKGLLGQMEKMIGDPSIRDPEVAKKSEADSSLDLDRVRWKAIYLSALLLEFVPDNEKEKHVVELRARVQALVEDGELSVVDDYKHCLEPLAMELESKSPGAEQPGPICTAFEVWIDKFPLFPLAGSVTSVGT